MIGMVIEGRYAGASVNKLPDRNVLFIQTEDGKKVALSKSNVISIDDVTDQYPSYGRKVMMVMWNDFETSIFQIGNPVHKIPEAKISMANGTSPGSDQKNQKSKKKPWKIFLGIFGVVCLAAVAILVGIVTRHEHAWQPATCTSAKVCSECGETEGNLLPHSWKDATCTISKTCADCGKTEGTPSGHTWIDATCTEAKICFICGSAEGEALGHSDGEWIDNPDNPKEQMLLCARCDVTLDYREYQVMSADGIAWTLGDIPDRIYNDHGFLISCNDFMGVYARALTLMPDRDDHKTQLNFRYDSHYDIKIMRDQSESFVAMSFEGNPKLQETMSCVSLFLPVDKLVNNYSSYKSVLLNILGALPFAIDDSLNSVEEGTEIIIELINSAADNDISKGTVNLIDDLVPAAVEKNSIVYTLFVHKDYLYVIASVGSISPVADDDFVLEGACINGESSNNAVTNMSRRGANMFWIYYDAATDPSKSGVLTTWRGIRLGDTICNVLSKYPAGEFGYFSTDCNFYKEIPSGLRQQVRNECFTYLTYFYEHYGIHFFFNQNNELTFVVFSKGINATA